MKSAVQTQNEQSKEAAIKKLTRRLQAGMLARYSTWALKQELKRRMRSGKWTIKRKTNAGVGKKSAQKENN